MRWGLVRGLQDWATPLEGCALCQYRYEREPGYFLGASWIHYGVVAATSLLCGLIADVAFHASLPLVLTAAIVPTLIICVPFVRWSKALFLAFDRYVDPSR
jgi:uncharacterized protein (DUF983 family)